MPRCGCTRCGCWRPASRGLLRIVPDEDKPENIAGEGAVTVRNPCLSGGALEIFLEPHLPASRVLVIGETPVAGALLELGGALGFAVVSGGRPPGARGERRGGARGHARARGETHPGRRAACGSAVRGARSEPEARQCRARCAGGARRAAWTAAHAGRPRHRRPDAVRIALSIFAEIVAESRAKRLPQTPTRPASAIDPVCGMEVAAGEGAIRLEHHGREFFFCSGGCRDAFAADPASRGTR